MTKHHVIIRPFAEATSGHAVAGCGAFPTRVVAVVHFRIALLQDAGARASKPSDVLCDVSQTELPGLACNRGFFPPCHGWFDSGLCGTRRWHLEPNPARSSARALHRFRTGKAVSDCEH